ncbi:phage/plasmid primase, P4 family [Acidithiobacillus sp. YTS05]|nr:phage/plasmid primase, P4 family [Acidithiobacillus sp. YTS05]
MIEEFLKRFRPGGPWLLAAIPPDGGRLRAKTFTDAAQAASWAENQNQTDNVYFSINPTEKPMSKKPSKEDIARVEWLYVDIDPRAGEEIEAERARILRLLTTGLPKGIPQPSLIIDSGGGFWGFWRLAEPLGVDDFARAEEMNGELARLLDGDHCQNVDRIARLPGTRNWPGQKKAKKGRTPQEAEVVYQTAESYRLEDFPTPAAGSRPPSAGAPARARAGVERSTASAMGTEELEEWAAENGKKISDTTLAIIANGQHPDDSRPYPSRSEALFRVCCDLIRAGVDDAGIFSAITDRNNRISESVLERGDSAEYARRQIERAHEAIAHGGLLLSPSTPLESARAFLEHERPHLLLYNDDWLDYSGAAYVELEDDTVRKYVYEFLERAKRPPTEKQREAGQLVGDDFRPNPAAVSGVIDGLRAIAHRPRDSFVPPCWLEGEGPPAEEVMACRNGLLHLPTGELLEPSPRFFTRSALAFDYDAHAPTPERWLAFLKSLWPEEPEAIDLLQEIFGYVLIPDTSLQKIFLIVGPTRSGKGTIARVLKELVGPSNVCAPSLGDFGENFGLEPLLGKQLATLSDVRLDRAARLAAIAETLLRISGEDTVTVNRKHKSAWTGVLPVRFLLLSNLMPRFSDASPALANRFVPLLMEQSFLGKEDPDLTTKLLAELPGILNWAIEGWRRLRERGRFDLPPSSIEATQELVELAAPVATFLREECELDPNAEVPKAEAFGRWRSWCDRNGSLPGALNSFSAQLYAATSAKVRSKKGRRGEERMMLFSGLRLKCPKGGDPMPF